MLTKINFEFEDRESTDLQVVNDMLRSVRFADVTLEDFEGYLATCREFDPDGTEKSVSYRYGFDSLNLTCEMPDEENPGRCYQLATEVVPENEGADYMFKRWKSDYPERRMRSQRIIGFSGAGRDAAVVLYWLAEE